MPHARTHAQRERGGKGEGKGEEEGEIERMQREGDKERLQSEVSILAARALWYIRAKVQQQLGRAEQAAKPREQRALEHRHRLEHPRVRGDRRPG